MAKSPSNVTRFALSRRTLVVASLLLASVCGQGEECPPQLMDARADPPEPVFRGGGPGAWDAKIRERGWILLEDGVYHLWYTGYDGQRASIKRLGYATSADGIHWNRVSTEPLLPDLWVEDMMVVRDGDTYYMFAEGAGDRAQLLTSTDRVHWQPKGTLDVRKSDGKPIPPGPFGTPTAWREDGTWHLFYERMDRGIWHATSKDLAVFTHVSDEPILRPGPEAWDARAIAMNQVLKVGDLYVASYHGLGNEGPNRWSHGLAISKDLRVWRKGAKNPFFPPEVNKSSGVYVPTDRGWLLFTMHDRVERHVLGQMPQENIQQSNP